MPDEKPNHSPAEESHHAQANVLLLLTDAGERPWSVDEIIRELGNELAALDALSNLHGAGLIHRTTDGFVWPTRAAIRAHEIDV